LLKLISIFFSNLCVFDFLFIKENISFCSHMYKQNISLTGCILKAWTFCMIFPFLIIDCFFELLIIKRTKTDCFHKTFSFHFRFLGDFCTPWRKAVTAFCFLLKWRKCWTFSRASWISRSVQLFLFETNLFHSNDESFGRPRKLHEFPG
jgi:hypothetical protein